MAILGSSIEKLVPVLTEYYRVLQEPLKLHSGCSSFNSRELSAGEYTFVDFPFRYGVHRLWDLACRRGVTLVAVPGCNSFTHIYVISSLLFLKFSYRLKDLNCSVHFHELHVNSISIIRFTLDEPIFQSYVINFLRYLILMQLFVFVNWARIISCIDLVCSLSRKSWLPF